MGIPNIITLLRVSLTIFFAIFFSFLPLYIILSCFIIAALTDYLDGFLARKFKKTTQLGRFLDPLADKFLVITAFFLISYHKERNMLLLATTLIVIYRELFILALRSWLLETKQRNLPSNALGKLKTAIQMICITLLLLPIEHVYIHSITTVMLVLTIIFSVCSAILYTIDVLHMR